MSATTAAGLGLGLALGLGLFLIVRHLPWGWRPSLAARVEPQMRHHVPASSLLVQEAPATPWSGLARIVQPLLGAGVGALQRFNPGHESLRRKLDAAGSELTVTDYRAQQVLLAVAGAVVSTLLAVALVGVGRIGAFVAVLIVVSFTGMAAVARDSMLSSAISRRRRRILTEFPSVAELFALSVSAGESTTGALERITVTARGELAGEFAKTLADIRAGSSLAAALKSCARRTQLPPLERFIDGILVALERGTPLADVVRAQAQDVRELSKRELMETAGRKEVHMMVPLVFGILPLTVLFAVFPGVALLDIGI